MKRSAQMNGRRAIEALERRVLLCNPDLAWSSYLGGTNYESSNGIAIDGSGNAWVTGQTSSSGWAVGGFDTSYNGGGDAFIAKINANGTLAWSSYLGGTNLDEGLRIAIDGSGNAWVTGRTDSSGWALGGFDPSYNGNGDAFVAKVNADGTLAWSSYLGGTGTSGGDVGYGIAIDGSGNAWVTGITGGGGLAVGGFDTTFNGFQDAFVAKINANGTLAWSSYLGGTEPDFGGGIAIDGSGNAWVTGGTQKGGWAVGGFDTSYNGGGDAFISKINADGTLAWSSYLGGTGDDAGRGIAIDGSGNAWVTGNTEAGGWAVGGFDTTFNSLDGPDGFVAKINANGTLAWSSYLGGTGTDYGFGIVIDGTADAWVTGYTVAGGWAVGGFDTSFNNGGDPFVAKINADGTLAWSSYLGGTGYDNGNGIAIDGSGNAWVTGVTQSSGWVVGGFDTSLDGGGDAFIAKITNTDVTPPAVTQFRINDGVGVQRSNLRTINVTFAEPVNVPDLIANGTIDNYVKVYNAAVPPLPLASLREDKFSWNAVTNTLTIDLTTDGPGGSNSTMLGNGRYTLRIDTAGITDVAGHALADGDGTTDGTLILDRSTGATFQDFFRLGGDLDGDADVDLSDLGVLATFFGTASAGGDCDGDGDTDLSDLGLLASNLQTNLPLARQSLIAANPVATSDARIRRGRSGYIVEGLIDGLL